MGKISRIAARESKAARIERGARWFLAEYARRAKRNPQYSIRAFARDLGIARTIVSDVMAQKRAISRRNGLKVAARLGLGPTDCQRLLAAMGAEGLSVTNRRDHLVQEEDRFRLIADWHYLALLNLAQCRNVTAEPRALADRLGLPTATIREALERLRRLGLLEVRGDQLIRLSPTLATTDDIPSASIRRYHQGILKQSARALEAVPVDLRHFEVVTEPIANAAVPRFKALIRDFTDQAFATASDSHDDKPDEVYALAIQFFPLTHQTDHPP